jgi:hypothetical protein
MRMIGMAALAATAALGCSAVSVTAYASSGHSSSRGGDGGNASSSGGEGGDSIGGNGTGCGGGSGGGSNDLNNILGGQTQILNGVNLLDNLFVPVLSPGGRVHQRTSAGSTRITHSRGAVDRARTGNTYCGTAGDGGNGGRGGTAHGGRGGSGGTARSSGG